MDVDNKINDSNIPALDAGKITSGVLSAPQIPDLSATKITTGTLNDARVPGLDAGKITTGAFTAAFLASNSVTSTKIADGSVSTSKIGDFQINGTKIASNAVDNSKISNGAVDGNKLSTGAVSNTKIADSAVDGNKLATNSVSTTKIVDLAVTGGKVQGIDGSKITDGTVNIARLPASIAIPGTGLVCAKTSGAYSTLYNASGTRLPYDFYNTIPSNTSDLQIFNEGGRIGCRALAAGWFVAEIGFQLEGGDDLTKFPYSWNLTPVIWKNGSIYKWGSSANYISWLDGFPGPYGFGNDFAQTTFIVPMAVNDYVNPGYFWSRTSGVGSATVIKVTSTGYGTYFGMSLLDKG